MQNKIAVALGLALHWGVAFSSEVIETDRLVGFGEAKYPTGFQYFDFVNPDAPKGGKVTYGVIGTYDNFNRFASRGDPAAYTRELYDTLFYSSTDELNTSYALIAEKARYTKDYDWMEVDIRPDAKFHDGTPITAHDVEFTFQTFMTKGVPQYRTYYKDVKFVKALNDKTVRIELNNGNKEVLFSLGGGTSVLPEHFWKDKDFSEPLSTPPVGSGPYKVTDYKSGQSVTYSRVKDYWAQSLPVNVGRNNFDTVVYDYYRDDTVMLEAFKAGEYDFRRESIAKNWATAYNGINFDKGYIKQEEITHSIPQAMQGFIFNVQSPVFQDARVREALTYAMDFEWMNKNLFYNQYSRTSSYFQNTEYQAKALPDEKELKILSALKGKVPERVFTEVYTPPATDGSGRIRSQMRTAFKLLKNAGWELKNKVMTNVKTGEPMAFELLIYSPSTERIAIPIQKNMKQMGIEMKIRTIDTTQYLNRLRNRDYDMVFASISSGNYPTPNIRIVWHSSYLDSTYNRPGLVDASIDSLTEQIAASQDDPEKLIYLGRALDRVLQWNFLAIPSWHTSMFRIATWDKFARPEKSPTYDLGADTWWIDTEKAQKLPEKRR
ncbi:putative ABC-type oligopeptide/dipeptide transport system, periplasmic component [Vibrio nigripulchritudo SOn1]|uniref:ABC-type oligopeptide/dipeptide transport system, periplasmic component n=1 Tax=Vibrio nigripulchritudo SOn1 TaxID=1238450 RepID=A0AAV2VSW0_9VIBR|nr:extracellular solute-binding protein [Vibrio nigripulchritudo]CCO47809.1 putative ABC-type oligopeptide/dipeptide transport system, periplasmic component [Vibrio nigripulchritudo SOn1]